MASTVATIGFTESSAEHFFSRIKEAGVKRVIDVRLHNTSQLAGFAKAKDLAYFLHTIAGVDYRHEPVLAPTEEIFTAYKKKKGDWGTFESEFTDLMKTRRIEEKFSPATLEGACLLCSEAKPHHCHRRLICDYLNDKWDNALEVRHL
ncbi:MAG: DUF488 domain-containing protein [Hyphomicrobiales bacterium]|nr:DUF488 domain-containing protein [Hyphomicrobiales bacterium]